MKTMNRIFAKVGAGVLMAALALNFNACAEQSPLSSSKEMRAKQQDIQILRYQDASQTKLQKIVSVAEMVTVQNGGHLELNTVSNNGASIQITLDVAAGSISQDAILSMSLDDELLIVTFNVPAGVTFSQTPTLTIVAQGLNSGEFDVEDLNLYTETNGQWQPAPNGSVSGGSSGSIIGSGGIGGPMTQNSRYAIGAE